jgi:hypothetical protein
MEEGTPYIGAEKPVYTLVSLLTGKLTGKFSKTGLRRHFSCHQASEIAAVFRAIP